MKTFEQFMEESGLGDIIPPVGNPQLHGYDDSVDNQNRGLYEKIIPILLEKYPEKFKEFLQDLSENDHEIRNLTSKLYPSNEKAYEKEKEDVLVTKEM